MKEQDLIDLGFERFDENDGGHKFHYYTLDLGTNQVVSFITPASDEVQNNEWYVEIFQDSGIMFDDSKELSLFINIVRRNTIDL